MKSETVKEIHATEPWQGLHDLILAQAIATPNKCALTGEDGELLSYLEMVARSGQWLLALKAAGLQPGMHVGISLKRSPDLVCAILGVLRAGCAYVPLDPAYPKAWLSFALKDSGVSAMLCDPDAAMLAQIPKDLVVCTPDKLPSLSIDGVPHSTCAVTPESIAYIIYTSGSTGTSKGVQIRHRNVLNFVHWAKGNYSSEELRCVLFATSVCFDLSIFEMMVPLVVGGTVYLIQDALSLLDHTPSLTISLINTVPSVMTELVRMNAVPHGVITVNLAGESVGGVLVEELYRLYNIQRICNLYGPTETTTYSVCGDIRRGERIPAIGRPIINTNIVLLDADGHEVPAGEIGEILITGEGVAAGYFNRPAPIQANFISWRQDSEIVRAYRTGDFGRWRGDGQLDFLGRQDDQVKVRGFRIELTQIEECIKRYPQVRDAAVVTVAGCAAEDPRLVAYVVCDATIIESVRAHLMRELPAYMMPSLWIQLDALKRLPNGKVDRSALKRLTPAIKAPNNADSLPSEIPVSAISTQAVPNDHASILNLPTDWPRQAAHRCTKALFQCVLDDNLVKRLRLLCQTSNISLTTLLQAVFSVLLYRHSGQCMFPLGIGQTSVRGEADATNDIATLMLDIKPDATFRELLVQIGLSRPDLPVHPALVRLSAMLTVRENISEQPNLNTAQRQVFDFSATSLDLALDVHVETMGISMVIVYNALLFSETRIARMAGNLQVLLDAAISNPELRINTLPLLSPHELHRILVKWNDTDVVRMDECCVHELVEKCAAEDPEALAVVFEGAQLTLGELNARANQLAHYLRSLGVGSDMLVGICIERSLEMVVGLLAILKAGGAYVPLDPAYPKGRLAYMISDARPLVLLTQRDLMPDLLTSTVSVVYLDDCDKELVFFSSENPIQCTSGDHLAYVIYTSGSTGQPKGVAIAHSGIINRLKWMQETYALTATDRVLQKTPFSFDVSLWEFFWPLANRATLVVAKPGGHQDVDYLTQTIATQKITTMHFVPPMLDLFLNNIDAKRCSTLRQVFCSGQELSCDLQQYFFARLPGVSLHNLYGPTEASVDVTYWQCTPGGTSTRIPIGKPISNTQIYILDNELNPVPIGVAGELHIAGVGLARGYLNQSKLTAEKFIVNPFGQPGSRMYKTGDLGRYLPDGNIEFLGRLDHQFKIRGYRVEAGEIEHALLNCTNVTAAVVMARDDVPGEGCLVAYVVAANANDCSASSLRAQLRNSLPDYMLPAAWVFLNALPLNTNGKIDRQLLLPPNHRRSAPPTKYVEPASATEGLVIGIWAEVLGVDKIGILDDFFELGGDSLLANIVSYRLSLVMKRAVPVSMLFAAPNPAAWAAALDCLAAGNALEVVEPTGAALALEASLSEAQAQMLRYTQLIDIAPVNNVAFRLKFDCCIDTQRVVAVLTMLCERHPFLRARVDNMCWVPCGLDLPLRVFPAAVLAEPDLDTLCVALAQEAIDPTVGLGWRAYLFDLDVQAPQLILVFHHLLIDEVSIKMLIKAIAEFFSGHQSDILPVPFPSAQATLKNYTQWQHNLTWWQERLQSCRSIILPVDRMTGSLSNDRLRSIRRAYRLDAQTCAKLLQAARKAGTTRYEMLLAALMRLMRRWMASSHVVIGSVFSSRSTQADEGIGFHGILLPLHIALVADASWLDILAATRKSVREARDHKDVSCVELQRIAKGMVSCPDLLPIRFGAIDEPRCTAEGSYFDVEEIDIGYSEGLLNFQVRFGKMDICLQVDGRIENYHAETLDWLLSEWVTLVDAAAQPQPSQAPTAPLPGACLPDSRYPAIGMICTIFEQVVSQDQQRIAIRQGNLDISYGTLQQISLDIAVKLARAVAPAEPVIVCCESVANAIGALLACLRIGSIFVPVSVNEPPSRLREIVKTVGARVALIDSPSIWPSDEVPMQYLINLSRLDEADLSDATPRAASAILGDARPAYVLFTSGSTGRPKGVAQSEAALAHHIFTYIDSIGIGPQDRVSLIASLCYDAALMDVFGALLSGARLLPWNLASQGLSKVARWLDEEAITVFHGTPSVFRAVMLNAPEKAKFTQIRYVVLGGEPARADDLTLFNRHCPVTARLVNGFGPSESTLALQAFFEQGAQCIYATLPIGSAVSGTNIELVWAEVDDQTMEGEIEIRSPWVMLGYVHAPGDLESLLCHTIDTRPRSHRTGDVARRLPDGRLLHCRRRDDQIKIAGVRVEPAEIEAAFVRMTAVREACVVLRKNANGDNFLVAFVVPETGMAPDVDALRRQMHIQLPSAMVPAHIALIPGLPYLPNGKVNHNALPTEQLLEPYLPLNAFELRIAAHWSNVLGSKMAISRTCSFMNLGGSSLTAMSVCAAIGRELGTAIPPSLLLANPTLEKFAGQLQAMDVTATIVPLSAQQTRFWFLNQVQGGADRNWILWGGRLLSRPNRSALEAALSTVIAKHELLHSRIRETPSGPTIVVDDFGNIQTQWLKVSEIEWPITPDALPEALSVPFVLTSDAPLRVAVLNCKEENYILFLAHHMVVDAASCNVILRNFDCAYARALGAEIPMGQDRPPSFNVCAARLHQAAERSREGDALAYWSKEFCDAKTMLSLPGLLPPASEIASMSVRRGGTIRSDLKDHLTQFCNAQAMTLSTVLIAVFATILCRYANEDEVIIGMPVSLRLMPEEADVVAPLLNTVPVRCRVGAEATYTQLCQMVHKQVATALDHAYLPFQDIVTAVDLARVPGRHTLYQAAFSFHDHTRNNLEGWHTLLPVASNSGTISCDIALTVELYHDRVEYFIDGAKGQLHSRFLERLCAQFPFFLKACLSQPDAALMDFPLSTEAQRVELMGALASSSTIPLPTESIVNAILRTAQTRGSDWATRGRHNTSYADLVTAARALCTRIQNAGATAGSFVPFVTSDTLNPAVVELGILMAGAAFVPIDPAWPAATVEKVLTDVGAIMLIKQVNETLQVRPWDDGRRKQDVAPSAPAPKGPEDMPIYAIYTSGSSGTPKAVSIAHRGILNRFAWMTAFFGDATPVTMQTTPLTFDSAVWQVLWPLTLGGTCVLPAKGTMFDVQEFASLIEHEGVNVIDFVPSILQALLAELNQSPRSVMQLQVLRWIILGAERLPQETASHIRQLVPAARIVNLYGPTEVSIGCIYHEIVAPIEALVPIGRPLPNVQAFILDRRQQLAPRGAIGELMLVGQSVGLGYLGQVHNGGFCTATLPGYDGESAYQTGDLVRWDESGYLEYHGRIDTQIKIRGVRIEITAIETTIRRHSDVERAVVLVRRATTEDEQDELIAFVSVCTKRSGFVESLFLWLREILPPHYVPNHIEIVCTFPTLRSGKLDGKVLLAQLTPVTASAFPYMLASSATTQRIHTVWLRVLPRAGIIGENETFFDAGGHSLLMLSLRRELNKEFGLALNITELFRHPTVRSQTMLILTLTRQAGRA